MHKSIFAIIFSLFILGSCSKKEEPLSLKKGTAIITGKVKNLSGNSKIIRVFAGSTVKDFEQTSVIDSAGNFRLEIEIYHPQDILAAFKERSFKMFIRPSDSIHLVIDEAVIAKEQFPIIEIEGTNPDVDISKAIQKYLRYCGKNAFNPDPKGKSEKEFLGILQQEIIRQDSILEKFMKNTRVSDDFKVWAQKDIRYSVASYLSRYKLAHNGYLFDDSLFPINDDSAFITSYYSTHLWNFAANIGILQDTITQNLLQKGKNTEAFPRIFNKITSNVEKGLSRDIMCYKMLLYLFNQSFEDYKIVSQKIDTYIENKTLKSVLFKNENEYKKQKALDISYLDPETNKEKQITGEKDFWKKLKRKYKGKVIFVDIWATWCAPCIKEIPYAKELHEYFEGKEIAFVNLCLDSDKSEWEKMIKSRNVEGDNYFFNTSQTQLLRGKLQFEGYPTYLIVDKLGNLVHKNAPKPSSSEYIKKLLNEWIEKDTP